MKRLYIVIVLLCFSLTSMAQVGIGTTDPDPSSLLDVSSTTQGMLTPRMTSAQIAAIVNPAKGLLVYDTDIDAFNYYDGNTWQEMSSTTTNSDYTGWAVYNDTQFTDTSPGLVAANTTYYLPNNAGSKIESQLPVDVSEFYNVASQTITGRNGDGLNVVIEFKMRPRTNEDTRVTLSINIGGTVGNIYTRDFVLTKGNGIEHYYLSSFNAYTLNTWEANGGRVLIRCTEPVDIYDIRYVLTRTHKAR
ncbi:hypothetical protein [Nonlabens ponticola]|uniref:Uncharacterized protein n=1 Tax=Nonlabens ponticola TaxID=2496866 RepID=A0A3S9MUJ5_9FLAO|nr:hypothetical protein [Nonlabens ponticola]AZQ42849.1 hypothetical protein EJ995_00835 [Nonlabens ponticola]